MGTVFAHLLETMPFMAAVDLAKIACSKHRINDVPVEVLRSFVEYHHKENVIDHPMPPLPKVEPEAASVWGWHSEGTEVTRVACRARENGHRAQVVLDSVSFGRHESGKTLTPHLRANMLSGRPLDLELGPRFLHSKWHILDGYIAEGTKRLWPLETHLDSAMVAAYAYELDGDDIVPYQPDDDGEKALDAFGGARGVGWMKRALEGDFMRGGAHLEIEKRGGLPVVPVGQTKVVKYHNPRILVVMSFATCKERADVEPGGILGMTKVHPHFWIKSSIPLARLEAAVKIKRPATTTVLEQYGNDGPPRGCCDSYQDLHSILVADSNNIDSVNPLTIPFWSVSFAYVDLEPEHLDGKRIKMVRRDRPSMRQKEGFGKRKVPYQADFDTKLRKEPFQGEFDNIHIAPRLAVRADRVRWMRNIGHPGAPTDPVTVATSRYEVAARDLVLGDPARPPDPAHPTDTERLKLDQVVMAPICEHDCFHFHTRWLRGASNNWNHGWGPAGPHSVPGATMVPQNQDVDIVLDTPTGFIYRVLAGVPEVYNPIVPAGQPNPIEPEEWQIVFHHGAAYAQGFLETFKGKMAAFLVDMPRALEASLTFTDKKNQIIDPKEHTAIYYWNFRYYVEESTSVDGAFYALERLNLKGVMDAARDY